MSVNGFIYMPPVGVIYNVAAGICPAEWWGSPPSFGADYFLPPFAPVRRLFGGKGDEGRIPRWPYGRICHRTDGGTSISKSVEDFLARDGEAHRGAPSRKLVERFVSMEGEKSPLTAGPPTVRHPREGGDPVNRVRGNDKAPNRYEELPSERMPEPDGGGIWGALNRFQDSNPFKRAFGIDGAPPKPYSTSTVTADGELVPWIAAEGPLAYGLSNLPSDRSLFDFRKIMPEIYRPDRLPNENGPSPFAFGPNSFPDWLTPSSRVKLKEVKVIKGRRTGYALTAPIAVYRIEESDSYVLYQNGRFQKVPVSSVDLKRGTIKIYRGIASNQSFRLVKFNPERYSDGERAAVKTYYDILFDVAKDSSMSFQYSVSGTSRGETDRFSGRSVVSLSQGFDNTKKQVVDMVEYYLNERWTTDRWIAEQKFGPNYLEVEVPLDNIVIVPAFVGEGEVRVVDPNRLTIKKCHGCTVDTVDIFDEARKSALYRRVLREINSKQKTQDKAPSTQSDGMSPSAPSVPTAPRRYDGSPPELMPGPDGDAVGRLGRLQDKDPLAVRTFGVKGANVSQDPRRMYSREVAEIELLTEEQEPEIAQRIESAWSRYAKMLYTLKPVAAKLRGVEEAIEKETRNVHTFFSRKNTNDVDETGRASGEEDTEPIDHRTLLASMYNGGDDIVQALRHVRPSVRRGIEDEALRSLKAYADARKQQKQEWKIYKKAGKRPSKYDESYWALCAKIEKYRKEFDLSPDRAVARYEKMMKHKKATEAAKAEMVEANLRLVMSKAKNYLGLGLKYMDLVQEGNIGLMTAVDKFDPRRGNKFSTFAAWWIKQTITHALDNASRTIRRGVYASGQINTLQTATADLVKKLERDPTNEELSEALGWRVELVEKVKEGIIREPLSLQTDRIQDTARLEEISAEDVKKTQDEIREVLALLPAKERNVFEMRLGIGEGGVRSLQDIGDDLGLTRERMRQIEQKGWKRLQESPAARQLPGFVHLSNVFESRKSERPAQIRTAISDDRLNADGLGRTVENPRGKLPFVAVDGGRYFDLETIAGVYRREEPSGKVTASKMKGFMQRIGTANLRSVFILIDLHDTGKRLRRFVREEDVQKVISSRSVTKKFEELIRRYSLVAVPRERIVSVEEEKNPSTSGSRAKRPTAPRRHNGPPLELMPGPDEAGIFGGVAAYIAAAEGKWTGEGRAFGIDGAKDAKGANAAGDEGSIVAIFDEFLSEAQAAKGSDVAVTAVPHEGFELRYDRKNNKVAVRLSPSISFDTALDTFGSFMESFSRFSRENSFVPAVAVELGDSQPFEYSLTAREFSNKAIDFAKDGDPIAAVFAARWAYALEPDSLDVMKVLSYVLLEQVRMFKPSADIDVIIQNLTEATQLAVSWQKKDSENEFVQKRFKDISYHYRRVIGWLWGKNGTPPHENIPLIISILEKIREIDAHPSTENRLRNLYTVYGQKLADRGRHREAEPYLQKAMKLEPGNIRIVTSLAMTVRRLGRPQEALEIVTSFMTGHEEAQIDQKLKLELAREYSELENFTEAEDILAGLLRESIDDKNLYYNASLQLAYVKHMLKKYSEAEDIYSMLPDSPRKAYKLGHLYRSMAMDILQGDPERLIMLEKALERSRYAYFNTSRTDPHFSKRKDLLADILKFAETECRAAGLEEKTLKYADERNKVAI